MIRKLVICVMMFCLLAAGNLTGKSSSWVWSTWRKAYEDFEMGEQAGLEKQYQTALSQFRRALASFITIRKRQPNWNKRTVEERIALCRRKISRIKEKMEEQTQANMSLTDESPVITPATPPAVTPVATPPAISVKPVPRTEVSTIPGSTAVTDINQVIKERNTYKERLLRAMIELDDLKKTAMRGDKSSATVQALLKEKYALERSLLVMKQKYTALQKSTVQPDNEAVKLKKQLLSEKVISNSLKKQITELKTQISTIKKDKEKALQSVTVDKYNVKLMADKLSALDDQIKRLNEKLTESDNQLTKTRKLATEANQASAQYKEALDKKVLEYNKLLKQFQEVRRNYTAADVKDQMIKENEKFRKKISVLEIQLKSIYSKHDLTLQECAKLAIENKKLKSSMANVSQRKGVYENDFENLSKKYRQTVKENQEKEEIIKELSLKIKNLNKEIKNFAARYDVMKKNSDNKELTAGLVDNDAVKLKAELKKIKIKLSSTQTKLNTTQANYSLLQAKNAQLKNSASSIKSLQAKAAEQNKSLEELKKLQQKNAELEKSNKSLKTLQDQYAKLTSECDSLRQYKSEYDKLKVTYDKLAKVRDKYISYTADTTKFKRLKTEYEKQAKALASLKKIMDENDSLGKQVKNLRKRAVKAEKELYELKNIQTSKLKPKESDREIEKLKTQIKVLETQLAQTSQGKKASTTPKMSQAKRVKTVVYLLQAAFNSEQQNDTKSAIWHYRKVLQLAPNNFTANRSLGTLLLTTGQNSEAAKCLEKAYSINKNSPDVLYGLSELAIRSKSYEKAANYLDKANIMDPNSVRGYYLRAMIFQGSGKTDTAIKELEKAIEKEPESRESLMALSKLLAENPKKLHAAREYYKRALEAGAQTNADLAKKLGLTTEKKGSKPAPKEKSAEFLIKSADDAINKKDYATASWFYRQLIKVQPKKATEWQFCLAAALIKQKKDQEAVDVLRKVITNSKNAEIGKAFADLLKQHPDSGVLNLYYAKFLMNNSPASSEAAKQAYQKAIKNGIKPDTEFEKLLKNK